MHADKPMGHDDCSAAGEPCELCCPVGELPELPPGFVLSSAVDELLDLGRIRPHLTATGRLPGVTQEAFALRATCGQAIDLSDAADVLHHATKGHERRRHDA